jgi:hypothetical protein
VTAFKLEVAYRSHLKKRILVQDQGGAEFQPAGILKYVEDLKRGPNAEVGTKDFFEIASNKFQCSCGCDSGVFNRMESDGWNQEGNKNQYPAICPPRAQT